MWQPYFPFPFPLMLLRLELKIPPWPPNTFSDKRKGKGAHPLLFIALTLSNPNKKLIRGATNLGYRLIKLLVFVFRNILLRANPNGFLGIYLLPFVNILFFLRFLFLLIVGTKHG